MNPVGDTGYVSDGEDDTLKSLPEVENKLREQTRQLCKIKEMWGALVDWHEKHLDLGKKLIEYKNDIRGQILEIDKEKSLLLAKFRQKIHEPEVSEQVADMLELNNTLRRMSTLAKCDDGKTLTSSYQSNDLDIWSKSIRIIFPLDNTETKENLRLSRELIDLARALDPVIFFKPDEQDSMNNFLEDSRPENSKLLNDIKIDPAGRVVKRVVIQVSRVFDTKDEAMKMVNKLTAQNEKLLRKVDGENEVTSTNWNMKIDSVYMSGLVDEKDEGMKPVLYEVNAILIIEQGFAGEQGKLVCNQDNNTYPKILYTQKRDVKLTGKFKDEHLSVDEVELAKELEFSALEYTKARLEVVAETIAEMRKLRSHEIYFIEKLAKLTEDHANIYLKKGGQDDQLLLTLKNIDLVRSRLDVIESNTEYVKAESDVRISDFQLKFDLKALKERMKLATAVKLLAQIRTNPISGFVENLLDDESG